jgi:hypothetical protein
MSITIRDITPGELSAIPSLNDSEVPHVNAMTRTMLERVTREAAYFRIAQRNETMAGFLIGLTPGADYDSPNYRWFSQHYEHFMYIDRIVVAAAARGQGLGQAFYANLADFAQATTTLLICEVNLRPSNEPSMRFHQRGGLEQVGLQQTEGDHKEVALMIKHIARPD